MVTLVSLGEKSDGLLMTSVATAIIGREALIIFSHVKKFSVTVSVSEIDLSTVSVHHHPQDLTIII